MYIIIPFNKFDTSCITFDERKNNNIINNSDFYMIHYVNHFCSIHNLIISQTLNNVVVKKNYDKYICYFDDEQFKTQLKIYEHNILNIFLNHLFLNRDNKSYTHNINLFKNDNINNDGKNIDLLNNKGVIKMTDVMKFMYNVEQFKKYRLVTNIQTHINKNIIKTKHITNNINYETNYDKVDIMLKISGICVTDKDICLIYKFIINNSKSIEL